MPSDTNNTIDVFVRDLVAHTTTRISVASDGTERAADSGSGYSGHTVGAGVSLSNDGSLAAFSSHGAFVADDTNTPCGPRRAIPTGTWATSTSTTRHPARRRA